MKRKCVHRSQLKGQGLVEYALIIVLVSVVVIVIASVLGTGVERIFGLIGASIGTKFTSNSQQLDIGYAECFVRNGSHETGVWVRGTTTIALDDLSGSTDKNSGGSIGQNTVGPGPTGNNTFAYTIKLANKADSQVCPRAVVIQSKNGVIAAWPLKVNESND